MGAGLALGVSDDGGRGLRRGLPVALSGPISGALPMDPIAECLLSAKSGHPTFELIGDEATTITNGSRSPAANSP